jgi:hypothetical protein
MAKKQISNYKFFPGVVPPAYNQYPNAVSLLTQNKDFIIEETNQYIKNQVAANGANSGSIWYNFAYGAGVENTTRTRIENILDGYIHDLTYGGNSSTYANASRYYTLNVLQIASAAVEANIQTTIKDQIDDYIFDNTLDVTVLNLVDEDQVIGASAAEAGVYAVFEDLADIVIDVLDIGLSSLPAPVAPNTQNGGLLPNAVFLLEANKRFIQEETIAYIQDNIDNNNSPYVFYVFDAEEYRSDVSAILESYISDLKKGGNRQTYFNAESYWENAGTELPSDRQPEIFAYTFVKNLIQNFIWANVAYTAKQILVSQVINFSYTAEVIATIRLKELSDITINVIEFGVSRLPTKISNRGFVKLPGFIQLQNLLLVTNSTRNTIMYNFADNSLAAEVTFGNSYDSNFAGALYGVEKITTITFDIDTSNMMVTDDIQIFVENPEQIVRLNSIGTDAMERQKVGIPQSMLDADFEYGLQPTKWQAIGLMRNYPSFYEIPGSDVPVVSVVTDASSATGDVGASLITITTTAAHGLNQYDPITIKALSNSVQGFSRAEGSFLVNSVPSTTQITYYAKSKVGTTNGEVLASTYTQLRKAGFYTGSNVGTPTFSVTSTGTTGVITTSLITPSGSTYIGFSAGAVGIGAPLTGDGVNTGTQITAVTGSGGTAASTTLGANAIIGDTTITVTSNTGIGPGLVFNRGDGVAVAVTDVTGNTVTLSGALTVNILGTNLTYTGLTQSATSGTGSGAEFNISRNPGYSVTVTNPGSGYVATDTVTIAGTNLDGTAPSNNATITVVSASAVNTVSTLTAISQAGTGYSDANGVPTTNVGTGTGLTVDITTTTGGVTGVTIASAGSGYQPADLISIGLTGRVNITQNLVPGSGYTTANGLSTTGDTGTVGTGLTVDIVASNGLAGSITLTAAGTGYTTSTFATTYAGAGTGCTVNVAQTGGVVDTVSISARGTGYSVSDVLTISGGNNDATITVATVVNGGITSVTVATPGSGYVLGDTITVVQGGSNGQGTFDVGTPHTQAQVSVDTITAGGLIQSATVAGTAVTAPTQNFISAVTLSEPTTAQIASGNTGIIFSAISTIQITFATAHGFIPGNTITTQITSVGNNAQLAAGSFFIETVPTSQSLTYTARAAGGIDNTLIGLVYSRPDSFFVHRPFDGGVQLGTAGPAHGSSAIRMSKKYIRYQSGKGVMYNTGALFAPSYDLRQITASGTAVGSVITITTDDTDHGCQVGAVINISGVTTSGYNGNYTVATVTNERQLTFVATQTLGSATPILGSPCLMSVKNWHGATVRAGIYDDQNGMFFQYDGMKLSVVRRSSTFQIAGTISINANSNAITGTNTRFTEQLIAGDRIVIRGMTHVVSLISNNTTMFVTPDFRGVNNVSNVKITKVTDLIVPQQDWNLDTMDGNGPSGYNIDIVKMQMIGIQHTWYGAGFIDFMLRGPDGNYVFVHRFRNSNVNFEAYMRTGNQPVRYEVINEGFKGRLSSAMNSSQTTVPMSADDCFWFPNSGTVYIDNELINFTGNSGTALVGCTRAASLTQFVAGSSRTFSAGSAASHTIRTGVILVSNTVTPIISHWGSAFMIDGQFDEDRGYLFNYAATGVPVSLDRTTAFLIRLAPSVSNALIGDLGERELLNRAQLLLSNLSISSDPVAGDGALVIEGVLNPINYPTNPSLITWTSLLSQAAGGQPSFAQIASGGSVTWSGGVSTTTSTVQGAFSRTLTANGINAVTNSLSAISFSAVSTNITAVSIGATLTAISFTLNITALGFNNNEPYGSGNNIYTRAMSTTRSDFLITNTAYNALGFPIQAGDTLTSANLSGGRTVVSVTPSYLGGIYTRIVMSSNASANSFTGSGNNVAVSVGVRATSTSRTDFYVTNAAYSALLIPIQVGDTLTSANLSGDRTISSITTSWSSTSYTRIVMSSAASTSSTAASGNNVSIGVGGTYGRALSTSRTDFLITQSSYAALTTTLGDPDPVTATTYLLSGRTISSITPNYITFNSVAYARVVMNTAPNASSPVATSIGGSNVTVTVTSSVATRFNTAISSSRNDFLITQTAYAASTIAVADVLSATTVLTGGQSIASVTANYWTISGTTYARIIMDSNGNSTSTAGTGNNVSVTSTSAITALYGSAVSTSRNDFLIPDSTATGSGIAVNDVLSISSTGTTLSTVTITGSAGQFSCASTYLAVGMRVTISGTYGGTGSITGYSNPTIYRISVTNGSTTFTLTTTGGTAIVTSAGTPTGLTYTLQGFISGSQTINSITPSYVTISTIAYTRIVMSAVGNLSSAVGSSNNVVITITAALSAASYVNKNYLFFTSATWLASGAGVNTKLATSNTQFPAGTSIIAVSSRTFGASTVYQVVFSQASDSTIAAAATITWQFGAQFALPGEQVFSFIANPGETQMIDLKELKELTATTLGGRGTFPNGPDVLAINVYKVSGTTTPANIILRWSEAQA